MSIELLTLTLHYFSYIKYLYTYAATETEISLFSFTKLKFYEANTTNEL